MRAKFINEYGSMGGYPPGAEHDPRAPWNEPADDSQYDIDLDRGEVVVKRRYDFTGGMDWEDWEEEKGYIDPEDLDQYAAKKLGIENLEERAEEGDYLEIEDIEDIKKGRNIVGYRFITNWGNFEASLGDLIEMSNIS